MARPQWEVEEIICAKVVRNRASRKHWNYWVKWKNYGKEENTWEPQGSFAKPRVMVTDFWEDADTGGRDYNDMSLFTVDEIVFPVIRPVPDDPTDEYQPEPSTSPSPPPRSSPIHNRSHTTSSPKRPAVRPSSPEVIEISDDSGPSHPLQRLRKKREILEIHDTDSADESLSDDTPLSQLRRRRRKRRSIQEANAKTLGGPSQSNKQKRTPSIRSEENHPSSSTLPPQSRSSPSLGPTTQDVGPDVDEPTNDAFAEGWTTVMTDIYNQHHSSPVTETTMTSGTQVSPNRKSPEAPVDVVEETDDEMEVDDEDLEREPSPLFGGSEDDTMVFLPISQSFDTGGDANEEVDELMDDEENFGYNDTVDDVLASVGPSGISGRQPAVQVQQSVDRPANEPVSISRADSTMLSPPPAVVRTPPTPPATSPAAATPRSPTSPVIPSRAVGLEPIVSSLQFNSPRTGPPKPSSPPKPVSPLQTRPAQIPKPSLPHAPKESQKEIAKETATCRRNSNAERPNPSTTTTREPGSLLTNRPPVVNVQRPPSPTPQLSHHHRNRQPRVKMVETHFRDATGTSSQLTAKARWMDPKNNGPLPPNATATSLGPVKSYTSSTEPVGASRIGPSAPKPVTQRLAPRKASLLTFTKGHLQTKRWATAPSNENHTRTIPQRPVDDVLTSPVEAPGPVSPDAQSANPVAEEAQPEPTWPSSPKSPPNPPALPDPAPAGGDGHHQSRLMDEESTKQALPIEAERARSPAPSSPKPPRRPLFFPDPTPVPLFLADSNSSATPDPLFLPDSPTTDLFLGGPDIDDEEPQPRASAAAEKRRQVSEIREGQLQSEFDIDGLEDDFERSFSNDSLEYMPSLDIPLGPKLAEICEAAVDFDDLPDYEIEEGEIPPFNEDGTKSQGEIAPSYASEIPSVDVPLWKSGSVFASLAALEPSGSRSNAATKTAGTKPLLQLRLNETVTIPYLLLDIFHSNFGATGQILDNCSGDFWSSFGTLCHTRIINHVETVGCSARLRIDKGASDDAVCAHHTLMNGLESQYVLSVSFLGRSFLATYSSRKEVARELKIDSKLIGLPKTIVVAQIVDPDPTAFVIGKFRMDRN